MIAALLCLVFFGDLFGAGKFTGWADLLLARTPGIVIGLGTLLLAILPVLVVYIILSKSIIKGVTAGSVKG